MKILGITSAGVACVAFWVIFGLIGVDLVPTKETAITILSALGGGATWSVVYSIFMLHKGGG